MSKLVVFLVVLGALLALMQFQQLKGTPPPPDGIAYFEVADQIPLVGYGRALPIHWSPLYPLFLRAGRAVFGGSIERELVRTAAGDAVLLVAFVVAIGLAFPSLATLCWPDAPATQRAWVGYVGGLALFCAFALLRVGLRMPDALVTSLVVATLWAWCQAMARRLDWRWCLLAGVLSGAAFLARVNLLHWSLVTAAVACVLAPSVPGRRRVVGAVAFAAGLAVLFAPQTIALSSARGRFTFGETGKIVFAQSYGARYDAGFPAWPVRVDNGDVRVFTDDRALNFPGFYDISREFEDAHVFDHWWRLPWAVVRSADACLFGNWSQNFALFWPLAWGLWPMALFALWKRAPRDRDSRATLRHRLAWLLMLAGATGAVVHLVSFCNAYYMPPYVIALLAGACLRLLDGADLGALRHRAARVVAYGFVLAVILLTLRQYRASNRVARAVAETETQALSSALAAIPSSDGGLRKIAVNGPWLGLYAVRLSGSQVLAEISTAGVLHDRARASSAVHALRERGVVALLIPRSVLLPDDLVQPSAFTRSWAIVDLRLAP
jgi:4-amino-4-deoxy-L-arabinose transferase-like glycosyltransferase